MALVKFTDNPKVTDTILLEITTPDAYGCVDGNPYKVDKLVIYYVERDFLGTNHGEYTKTVVPSDLQAKLERAQADLCADPTDDNLLRVQRVLDEISSSAQNAKFYYKDRVVVKVVGDAAFPAWLSTDTDNAFLTNTGPGQFTYEWTPDGSVREGDFFLCWTWTPLPAGDRLTASEQFHVEGDPRAVTAIPTHRTPAGKYETLLDRYLPEMYKAYISDNDQTPDVLDNLNQAVAKGFTVVEDMANQIIDLFDANALHESLLVYLSNLFNLKLRSGDPTLWRRQIKEAVPLFKKKGTLQGLKDAFAQAGMSLNKFTQYWQVVSPYTWVESFKVKDSVIFTLAKPDIIFPLDPSYTFLWLKREGTTTYQSVPVSYVSFDTADDGAVRMTWVADNLSNNAVDLYEGDTLKVMYQYREFPSGSAETIEAYIQTLPLADQRAEDDQEYPPKNWNVRLIAEEDPMFDVLVPVRHPFADPLVFGYVRTDFAYSENIYNMEEYNGSTRPSYDPCRIDKDFLDPCGACLSSLYSVDIGVEELSNDRMLEAQEILREFTPFHAQPHTLNFAGEVNEFVQPPAESVEMLVTVDFTQNIISGDANPIFHRFMQDGLTTAQVNRQQLTDQYTVLSGKLGTAYNDHIALVSPDVDLDALGVDPDGHILEVLAPSSNAGTYQIDHPTGHVARVKTAVDEPVDETAFTFVLSNIPYGNSYSTITEDNENVFSDDGADFDTLGVKSLWDLDHTPDYAGGAWKVSIPAYSSTPYEIVKVTQGVLYLKGDGTLPALSASGITYTLLDDTDEVVATSSNGTLAVRARGYVNLNDIAIVNIHDFVRLGDYLYYDGEEYKIIDFDGHNFWIEGYDQGNASGVSVQIRRRLADQSVGYFGYKGLRLTTFADHEAEFGMINGKNPPLANEQTDDSHFKENYLFLIDGEYYKIVEIDEKEVVLAGRDQNWMTMDAGGTTVAYSLVHFPTKQVNIGFTVFDQLNRNGKDPIIREIFDTVDSNTAIVALSASPSSGLEENTTQEEGISFYIERRDGSTFEGEL